MDLPSLIPIIQQNGADLATAYATYSAQQAAALKAVNDQLSQLQAANGTLTAQAQGQVTQLTSDNGALKSAIAQAISLGAKIFPANKTGADLAAALTGAADNQTFILGAAYTLPPAVITAKNVRVLGLPGASLTFAPTGSTGIEVRAPGFSVSGVNLAGPAVNGKPYTVAFYLKYGATDFHLSDVTVPDGQLQNLVKLDPGADRAQIVRATVGMTSGCVVFCSADDLLVAGLTASGSTDEHIIRFDAGFLPDLKTVHRPQRGMIVGGVMANGDGKEVVACREIDYITIAGITIPRGWLGFGQSGGDGNVHCSHVRVSSVSFAQNARPGAQLIDVNHDVDCVASDVTAYGYADVPAVIVDARSRLVLQGGKQLIPAGVNTKQFAKTADPSAVILGLETVQQVAA